MIDSGLLTKVLNLAVAIQQIPAPTFAEAKRGEFVAQQFRTEGLDDVHTDEIGNVFARLPGRSSARPIVITAHLDTVFPFGTDLRVQRTRERITAPGIGDNALGVAGLFGLLWLTRSKLPLNQDLWLIANVGEEGLGDLCGMQAVVARFQHNAKAYIILEGMALGSIYHRGLDIKRFRIEAQTQGGHSWVNFGSPSAIHELTRLVALIQDIPIPALPRTSYNIGIIQGGTSINTIAAQAMCELDLRSENPEVLENLVSQVMALVGRFNHPGDAVDDKAVNFRVTPIGRRPYGELPADHPLPRLVGRVLEELGISPRLEIGSTDANVPLSLGYPAVCIGLTTGKGAHTLAESIDTAPLTSGLTQLYETVSGVERMPG